MVPAAQVFYSSHTTVICQWSKVTCATFYSFLVTFTIVKCLCFCLCYSICVIKLSLCGMRGWGLALMGPCTLLALCLLSVWGSVWERAHWCTWPVAFFCWGFLPAMEAPGAAFGYYIIWGSRLKHYLAQVDLEVLHSEWERPQPISP